MGLKILKDLSKKCGTSINGDKITTIHPRVLI